MRTEEANRHKDKQVFSHVNFPKVNVVSNDFSTKEIFKNGPKKGLNQWNHKRQNRPNKDGIKIEKKLF